MGADYYATLGVGRDADDSSIKKAFRQQARQLHPDVNRHDPAAEESFKELNEAYEVLSDPEKRAMYDRYGSVRPGGAGYGDPFGGFDPVSDIFGMFFGDAQGRGRVDLSGRDLALELIVDLPEAVFGVHRDVTLDRMIVCGTCSGRGAEPGSTAQRCDACGGRGVVRTAQRTFIGQVVRESICPTCGGLREVISSPCKECGGQGRLQGRDTLTLDVPAGVEEGTTLRITGAGDAGLRGGAPGDLFVHVRLAPHEVFERHGDNLYALLPLTFAQAALGAKLAVPTLDGDLEVSIPAGTQPGERFVTRGKGTGHLHGRGRGDLILEAVVEVPRKVSRETKKLIEQLEPDAASKRSARLLAPQHRKAR